jgi:hypothetical protein
MSRLVPHDILVAPARILMQTKPLDKMWWSTWLLENRGCFCFGSATASGKRVSLHRRAGPSETRRHDRARGWCGGPWARALQMRRQVGRDLQCKQAPAAPSLSLPPFSSSHLFNFHHLQLQLQPAPRGQGTLTDNASRLQLPACRYQWRSRVNGHVHTHG